MPPKNRTKRESEQSEKFQPFRVVVSSNQASNWTTNEPTKQPMSQPIKQSIKPSNRQPATTSCAVVSNIPAAQRLHSKVSGLVTQGQVKSRAVTTKKQKPDHGSDVLWETIVTKQWLNTRSTLNPQLPPSKHQNRQSVNRSNIEYQPHELCGGWCLEER